MVTSPAASVASPGQTAYSAAKAGVIGLTRSLAVECAPRGVTVNAVAPGLIDTAMTSMIPARVIEEIMRRVPVGRKGFADEIAVAVQFLVDSPYVTGQTIAIDGGIS